METIQEQNNFSVETKTCPLGMLNITKSFCEKVCGHRCTEAGFQMYLVRDGAYKKGGTNGASKRGGSRGRRRKAGRKILQL